MQKLKRYFRDLLSIMLLLYIAPQIACAGLYGNCVMAYDFGNRATQTIYLYPVGYSCMHKCRSVCSVFVTYPTSGNNVVSNDQAAGCYNACQRGVEFSGFIFENAGQNGNILDTNRRIANSITIPSSQMCTDADLKDITYYTHIEQALGDSVYISIDSGAAPESGAYPNTVNQVFKCGYNEVALEPVIFSKNHIDWTKQEYWFDDSGKNWNTLASKDALTKEFYNARWLPGYSSNGFTSDALARQHFCFSILTDEALGAITSRSLWGGYVIINQQGYMQQNIWANSANIRPEYRKYNYPQLCSWNARNFDYTDTGIRISDGDYLNMRWTNFHNNGYRSLGGWPFLTGTTPPFTEACLSNDDLYPRYIGEMNKMYDSTKPSNSALTGSSCIAISGSTTDIAGISNAAAQQDASLLEYDYMLDPNRITASDIDYACNNLLGYNYLQGHPESMLSLVSNDSSVISSSISNFSPTISDGTGGASSLFRLVTKNNVGINNFKFLISESNQEYLYNYSNDYNTYFTSHSTFGRLIDKRVNNGNGINLEKRDNCNVCGSVPDISSDRCEIEVISEAEYEFCQPIGPLYTYSGSSSSSYPIMASNCYSSRNRNNNTCSGSINCTNIVKDGNNPYCSWWDRAIYINGYNTDTGDTFINNTEPCVYKERYKKTDFGTVDMGFGQSSCVRADRTKTQYNYWARRFYNFHCNLSNASYITSNTGAAYTKCRGMDMPIIWDAYMGRMFFSTAITGPNTVFGQRFLPKLASLNSLFSNNTAWKNPNAPWQSFNYGAGFALMCKSLFANDPNNQALTSRQAQVSLINNNTDSMFMVIRTQNISMPYLANNKQLFVPASQYDKLFGTKAAPKLLHHYDYLQAIGILLEQISLAVKDNTGPYINIPQLLQTSRNNFNLPLQQASSNSCSNGNAFGALFFQNQAGSATSEWLLRSSLEVNFGGAVADRYGDVSNIASGRVYCSLLPSKFVFTGALFSNDHFSRLLRGSDSYSDASSNWQNTISNFGLTPNVMQVNATPTLISNNNPSDSLTIASIPMYDYLYQLSGNVKSVGSDMPLTLRHPTRKLYSTNGSTAIPDRQLLWNQVGGTKVFLTWGGCPVSAKNVNLEYQIVDVASGNILQDWQSIPNNVLNDGSPLYFTTANNNFLNTNKKVAPRGTLNIRLMMKNDSMSNFSTSCSGKNCAYNRFGSVALKVTSIAPLSFTPNASTTSESLAFSNALGEVVNLVYKQLFGDGQNLGTIGNMYQSIISDGRLYQIARALVALYLITTALMFMLGQLREPQHDVLMRLFKISVVLFATSPTSFDFFYNQMFRQLSAGSLQMIYAFIANMISDVDLEGLAKVTDLSNNPGAIFIFLSGGWQLLTATAVWLKIFALLFSGYFGIVIVAIVVITIVVLAINLIKIMFSVMLAFIGLGLMLLLAPLFISFSLFQVTQNIFQTWWKITLSFIIGPPILFLSAVMFNFLALASISNTLSFTACPSCLISVAGFCLLPVYRPIIFTSITGLDSISIFYLPLELIGSAVSGLLIVYTMYMFIDFVQGMLPILLQSGNMALLKGSGQPLDQRLLQWGTGRDRASAMQNQEANKDKKSEKSNKDDKQLRAYQVNKK